MSPHSLEPRARGCPVCGRPTEAKLKPFCSKHCADVDLARWLDGRYAIPGRETDQSDLASQSSDEEDKA